MAKKKVTLADLGISTETEDLAIMPSEGMAFPAGSLIAKWKAGVFYSFGVPDDVDYEEYVGEEDGIAAPGMIVPKGSYKWLYYRDYSAAKNAYEILSPEQVEKGFKPTSDWVFYTDVSSVLNRTTEAKETLKERVGNTLLYSSRVQTLRTGNSRYPAKNRHGFCLIALPAAVAATADLLGYENAGFDLTELTEPRDDADYTDEFFTQMCGDLEGRYDDSVLFIRRASLWASLGEDNPKAQAMKGSVTASGRPNSLATSSERLSQCLAIAQGRWKKPLWARVVTVNDPLPTNGFRPRFPALTEIYTSEEEAREAAKADLEARGEEVDDAPALPENWSDYRAEFIEAVKSYDGPKTAPKIKAELDCSKAEYEAWVAYIEEKGL